MSIRLLLVKSQIEMKKITIIAADENEFVAQGTRLAALADAGKSIPNESVISFGDPADLLKILTPARSGADERRQNLARFDHRHCPAPAP